MNKINNERKKEGLGVENEAEMKKTVVFPLKTRMAGEMKRGSVRGVYVVFYQGFDAISVYIS